MGQLAGEIYQSPIKNRNHPTAGSSIKVHPIRAEKDIRLIKKMLADHPRNLAIFVMGINTNLRASDLLRLTIGHVLHVKPGELFYRIIREKKTSKVRDVTMNNVVHEVVQALLKTLDISDESAFLFQSRKGKGKLSEEYLNQLVKGWCREINLRGNFGSHTLRKTWGYIHRTKYHTDIPTLMTMFNHSNERQTLAYLCIQPEEIKDAYLREI